MLTSIQVIESLANTGARGGMMRKQQAMTRHCHRLCCPVSEKPEKKWD
jgi:hypothetical protein